MYINTQLGNVSYIQGNNFSGRSDFLKSFIDLNNHSDTQHYLYISDQISSLISGICPTVKNEIDLHISNKEPSKAITNLINNFKFEKLYQKNPFRISGGEQTVLVFLCALLLKPKTIGLDNTFEQLNEKWRNIILNSFNNNNFNDTKLLIADNRLDEYDLNNAKIINYSKSITNHKLLIEKPTYNNELKFSGFQCEIELKGLSFSYEKNCDVLSDIDLLLTPNLYHLKGDNGAGKSTLAKILSGIIYTSSDKILVNNKPQNLYKYPGKFIGYSFQNPDEQFFNTSVENEMLFKKRNESNEYGVLRENFLTIFGLQNFKSIHPAELPFVLRKRLSIACTLAIDRPWYILDEPTLGQDNEFIEFLLSLLHNLVKKGKGIILISHSKSFIQKANAKTLNLINGKIIT